MTVLSTALELAQVLTPNSGIRLRDILLGIAGTFVLVLFIFRAVASYAAGHYGQVVTSLAVAVIVGGFAYFPDQAVSLLKGFWNSFVWS
ncbi:MULTISPECIES: hypothetical protein [unclassified Crossiella]|uniref:hypothetical protein n=1 Tax=unclassified Crossiella TaxID=2620835 RepID=UPI001FFEE5AA|nr:MULTISPECIES: hypothetical protein [unclassified Crossiella]MCK2239982.1 hypothetical protein [Crossiella sp. S99.2]MCK2252690.1 hypothetical protein [Crossiella sp. S99.1]